MYRVVARKGENLSNRYLFLQRITFTKFFKDQMLYYTHKCSKCLCNSKQHLNLEIQACVVF